MINILVLTKGQCRRITFIFVSASLLFWYCYSSLGNNFEDAGLVGMTFQLLSFFVCLILFQNRDSERLTVGNIDVLFSLVCLCYLLFPSIIWLTKSEINIQYGGYVTEEIGTLLCWLHGLYFLAFVAGYSILSRPSHNFRTFCKIQIPPGFLLLIVAIIVLVLIVIIRQVLSTGQFLPQQDRGISTLESYEAGIKSIQMGGLRLIFHQILNKLTEFNFLFLGIGIGLVYAKSASKKLRSLFLLIITVLATSLFVVFTGGGRGPGLIVMLMGLVFFDYIMGPVRWRYLFVLILIGLVGAEFIAYARFLTGDSYNSLSDWVSYWMDTGDKFFELTVMFGKEAVVVSEVKSTGEFWGLIYFPQIFLKIIPQQLMPLKSQFPSVSEWLSDLLLTSDMIERGSGLAGTAIGEGYLVGGVPGVAIIGGMTGLILGLVQRWLLGSNDTRLWQLIPLVYVAGNLLFVLRSDLYSLLNTMILGVLPLWLFLRSISRWLGPASLWNQHIYT